MATTKKSQRVEKVKKATKGNPYFELTEVYAIAEDADKFHALKTLLDQEGGQILLNHHIEAVKRGVEGLSSYQHLDRDQLVSIAALITTNLDMARALSRAAGNLEMADEALDDALRE